MRKSLMVIPDAPDVSDVDARAPVRSDDALIARGSTRRYLTDVQHADEARALYTSLGFDVTLQSPMPSQLRPECHGCREVACRDYVLVYTRSKTHADGQESPKESPNE